MASINLGKVVGSDARINGQTAITLSGANGVSVITSGTDVTVDGNDIKTELTTHTYNTDIHVTAEEKAAWSGLSNPNLLINPDFKINQRGKTVYDVAESTGEYTVDHLSISKNLTLTVCDGYIRLCKSILSGNPTFVQSIENMSEIAGKTVTFSMRYRSNVQLRITGLGKNYYIPSTDGEWGNYTLTFTAPAGVNYLFAIQFTTAITQADNYIDIMWTKAELGSIATPFIPPDPATELAKCQRYFVRLKNNHASAYAYNGTGYIMNETTAVITLSLPVVMRIPNPTVTASGENIPCIITPTTPVKTPIEATYYSQSSMLANSISLVFTISAGIVGEPAVFLLKPGSDYIDISAEL